MGYNRSIHHPAGAFFSTGHEKRQTYENNRENNDNKLENNNNGENNVLRRGKNRISITGATRVRLDSLSGNMEGMKERTRKGGRAEGGRK